jgi:hypothetical protein
MLLMPPAVVLAYLLPLLSLLLPASLLLPEAVASVLGFADMSIGGYLPAVAGVPVVILVSLL